MENKSLAMRAIGIDSLDFRPRGGSDQRIGFLGTPGTVAPLGVFQGQPSTTIIRSCRRKPITSSAASCLPSGDSVRTALPGFQSRLKNDHDGKDVVQEIYPRLLRLGQGELVRDPHAYVYLVASQVLAQFRMRAKSSPLVYDSTLLRNRDRHPEEIGQDAVTNRWMALAEVEELLGALPSMHRKVFTMRKLDGLSWSQIAERLHEESARHPVGETAC